MDDNANVPLPEGANKQLPALNPLKARSTIAAALMVAQGLSTVTAGTGFGTLLAELVTNGDLIQDGVSRAIGALDVLIALGAPVWFWLERRAPQARLSFSRR